MQRRPYILATLTLIFALAFAPLAQAASSPPVKSGTTKAKKSASVTLDFKDIELTDLIQTISEMTGKNFVYDDTVKGKVTIISPRGMSLDEAYQVFLSVLSVKGFTIVPSGKMNKVVRTQDAKENTVPTGSNAAQSGAEQIVTRLVPLSNIDAASFATSVLTPLIPKSGSVIAYAPSNTLIITDSTANIDRLLKIIAELDVPGTSSNFDIIFLENASAEEIAQIGTQVLAQGGTPQRKARGAAPTVTGKVLAYPRSNALIVLADEEEIATIRSLVQSLDGKQLADRSNINVYYLENSDAESLAKTLNEIISGVRKQTKPAAGQAAAQNEPVTITADKATNSLIINALPEDYDQLKVIVKQLDIRRKQVFVEALILELSMDATQKLGASLAGILPIGNESVGFGVMNQVSPGIGALASSSGGVPSVLTASVEGILAGGFFNMVNVTGLDGTIMRVPALSALINLSKTDTDVNIVSAPRLLTSDNEEAQIIVGSNVPIITSRLTNAVGSSSSSSSGLATSVQVERKDVALTLRFTPQVTEGNLVRLKVFQEITDIAKNSVGSVDQVGPTFTKRLLQNTVVAEDGKTVVLGGLIGNSVQEIITKVPILGDIPFLGWLFKRKETVEKKTNLLIFITPRIIRNADDLARVTQSNREDMNQFQKTEMKEALKKNKYGSAAMERLKESDSIVPASPLHE